jgi:signal transduction histidine kinase
VRTRQQVSIMLGEPWVDLLLAIAFAVEMELETWLGPDLTPSRRLVTAIAVIFYAMPVAFRRWWPRAALLTSATVALVQAPLGGNILGGMTGSLLPPIALAYRVGTVRSFRKGLPTVGAAAALLGIGVYVSNQVTQPNNYGSLGGDLVGFALAAAAPWVVGRMIAERVERASAFRELTSRLERRRQEHQNAAIVEERMRIGRETQDIIAQSISAIVVQTGGARQLIESDPDRAYDSIQAIEHTGREALADLRRALMILHPVDATAALVPPPGLSQLSCLAAAMSNQSITCTLDAQDEVTPASTGVDLLGYRLAETALSIAVARGASRATITLGRCGTRLDLRIAANVAVDDLTEQLCEIRERMLLYDGIIQSSPGNDRCGFMVQAHLPLRGGDR